MQEETGTVVELRGKHIALVHCRKSSFCAHCASMELCHVADDNKSMLVEAHNVLGAKVGDEVKLAVSTRNFLQSSFLVYIVPLIALVLGAILGRFIGSRLEGGPDPDLLAAVFGVAFLAGAFLIIKAGTKAIPKERYMPRIVEILPGDEAFVKDLTHGD